MAHKRSTKTQLAHTTWHSGFSRLYQVLQAVPIPQWGRLRSIATPQVSTTQRVEHMHSTATPQATLTQRVVIKHST